MSIGTQKFSQTNNTEFVKELRARVNAYFEEKKISRHGNKAMTTKTIVMFSMFVIPYFVIISGLVLHPVAFIGLWIVMGFGMAGIGLNIGHDAIHGSYSSKFRINKLLGMGFNLIGASDEIWRLQHNTLHHTYTNIEGVDDDIHTPKFLRFSPHAKLRKVHKFQHLYVWILYSLSTFFWVTVKEFGQVRRYRELGVIKTDKQYSKIFRKILLWKTIYYTYILIIPTLLLPFNFGFILLGFVTMHIIAGFCMSLIFQTAHVMPECEFPLPDEKGQLENNWMVHEMVTTTNYAPKNKFLTWCVGALNFQVEHHLFPNICHVHYPEISRIVVKTSEEFGVPYNTYQHFRHALKDHVKMLYSLGNGIPVTSSFQKPVAA